MDFDPGIELFWTISITVSSILGVVLLLQYCFTPSDTAPTQGLRSPYSRMEMASRQFHTRSRFSHGRKQRHYYRKHGRRLRRVRNQALGCKGALLRACCCGTGRWNPPRNALEGEIALVTGSASGIGLEIAYQLAAQRCSLVLVDIDTQGLREVADDITVQYPDAEVWMARLDVSDCSAVFALAEEIEDKIGSDRYISILVNNAGIVVGKTVEDVTTEEFDRTMAINTNGPFYLTKAFLPAMIEGEHGHIVGISSIMGLVGSRQLSDYCASKAAHSNFMTSLRLEMKSEGLNSYIRTLTVMPCLVSTGMFSGAYSDDTDTTLRRLLFPTLRPEEVAQHVIDGIIYDKEVSGWCPIHVLGVKNVPRMRAGSNYPTASQPCNSSCAVITRSLGG
eukprot:gb/GECG01010859.1/.p1 GENE.gb/GECG01010859.1/~~gb/GECG01010859.1/.p1  ORF type:complete len:392 (+),score=17.60 gb/GECG01010859.1/:1-1176(+)